MELATGTVVDRYTVESILGEGGMAVVYLCRHNQLGTLHALKVLSMSSRAIRERLVQEGRVQASLRHRNVVAVTDIIALNGAPGLVMEYIEGPSLDELLEQKPLTYEQVEVLAEGIIDGVAYAHGQGLVHRDLKPANIMLALEGSSLIPKVTDFGLAKLLAGEPGRAATRTGSTMGTPHYMSPEQVADSKNVDHRTDVFALGAILYELVCGRRAFGGENLLQIFNAAANAQFVPPRQIKPDLPERMERAILSALEPDRDKRVPTVEALRDIWLGRVVGSGGVTPTAPEGPFSAEFLSSVSRGSVASQPEATWSGETGISDPMVVSVESLHRAPEPEPVPVPVPAAPQAAAVPPPPVDGVPADSMVSGRSLVVGGGVAMFGGLLVGGVLIVILLLAIAGFSFFALGESEVAVTPQPTDPAPRVEPVEPEPVAVAPTPARPGPRPEPKVQPRPGPVAPVAEPLPQPVVEPEPTAEPDPVAEPEPIAEPVPPPPAPAGLDLSGLSANARAGLTSEDPQARLATLRDIARSDGVDGILLHYSKSDPDREVRVVAFEQLCKRYKEGRGDTAAQERMLKSTMKTGVFSRTIAVKAYGQRGTELEPAIALLSGYNVRVATSAGQAVVSIANRTGQQAKARAALERRRDAATFADRPVFKQLLKQLN